MKRDQLLLEDIYECSKILTESRKQGKLLVQQGKITEQDFNNIVNIDPTPQKKYTGWMCKQWALKSTNNLEDLQKAVTDWERIINIPANRQHLHTLDITNLTLADVQEIVEKHGGTQSKRQTKKAVEDDYDIIVDNDDVLIISPNTHAAARKLGLSVFAHRMPKGGGNPVDSAWCITHASERWWNDYFFARDEEFRFIKVKSSRGMQLLHNTNPAFSGMPVHIVALQIPREGDRIIANDADDRQLDSKLTKQYINVIKHLAQLD